MENEVKKLMEWLSDASNFTLPEYSSLPAVPLYMEQVIMYISKILDPISVNEKNKLTSFMVNNYVKAGMIDPPEKKKYSEDHLGYLLAITVLKDTLSMTDLSLLIEMDNDLSEDKSVLYRFFASMSTNTIQEKAKSILSKVESYQRRYEKEVKEDKELAEKHLKDSLGLIAFRLAIQSQASQTISKAILAAIAENMHGEEVWQAVNNREGHEVKKEMEIYNAESERIAKVKRKQKEKIMKEKEIAAKKDKNSNKKEGDNKK